MLFPSSAILFDLDGVLVDSTQAIVHVWTRWARGMGLDPEKVLGLMHGRRTVEVLQLVAPHLDPVSEAHRVEQNITDDKDGAVAMPGAADLLAALRPDQWCVVTSGTRRLAAARLQKAGLPVPRVLVSADDVTKGKPDPEPYLKGAELLGVAPELCLVIEDAPLGIRAAHAAGMKAIGLASTYSAAELRDARADAIVQQLAEVRVSGSEEGLEVRIQEETESCHSESGFSR